MPESLENQAEFAGRLISFIATFVKFI